MKFLFILTFLAIIPFLFNRRVRNRLKITSLYYFYLLKQKIEHSSAPQRFTLENWLPILILFLLTAAIVFQTIKRKPYEKAVFVIDCSARMKVLETSESRFQQAIELAQHKINNESFQELMIIAAKQSPQIVLPFSKEPKAWEQTLDKMQPIDCESDIEAALVAAAFALDSPINGSIFIYTDTKISPDFLKNTKWKNIYVINGENKSKNNVGIINFNDKKSITSQAPIFVDIKNFSTKPETLSVTVGIKNDAILYHEQVILNSGQIERFYVPKEIQKKLSLHSCLFAISLDLIDSFALDNEVVGSSVFCANLPRICLISNYVNFNQILSIYASHSGYEFIHIESGKFYSTQFSENDILVFHRFTPESINRYKTILLDDKMRLKSIQEKFNMVHPMLTHPLLNDITLEIFGEFSSPRAPSVENDEPQLLDISEQPWYGYFYVSPKNECFTCLTDEIFLFDKNNYNQEKEQVAIKILVNALELCSKQLSIPSTKLYCSGDLIPIQSPEQAIGAVHPIHLVKPNNIEEKLAPATKAFVSEYVGIYTINHQSKQQKIPVNLLNENVSSIKPDSLVNRAFLKLLPGHVSSKQILILKRPNEFLILLILLLLTIDWLYFFRPWHNKKGEAKN